MLLNHLKDHRRSSDAELVEALRDREAMALAEAYHRTVTAGHACARRLLLSSSDIEVLLRTVYTELWDDPPTDVALEAWVRHRCFALATTHLRDQRQPPAAPSLGHLLEDLPTPVSRHLDPAEQALADMDATDRLVLLRAHDQGRATGDQDDADAGSRLQRALVKLSGTENEGDAAGRCHQPLLADWVLGLVKPDQAAQVAQSVADDQACGAMAGVLRRGRRRLEGLPPTPDMGQRILVAILAGAGHRGPTEPDPQPVVATAAEPVTPDTPPAAAAPQTRQETEPDDADEPRSALDDDFDALPEERPREALRLSDLLGDTDDDEGFEGESAPPGIDPGAERHAADDTEDEAPEEPAVRVAAWSEDEDQEEDDEFLDEDAQDQPRRRHRGRRFLRLLGGLLLLALGSMVGLYVGQLLLG